MAYLRMDIYRHLTKLTSDHGYVGNFQLRVYFARVSRLLH